MGGDAAPPTAVMLFGGETERECFAVDFVTEHALPYLFVSGPTACADTRLRGVPAGTQVSVDWRALDTLSNFTTTVPKLREHGVTSVYLLTNHYHMRRVLWCAASILRFYGIAYTPLPVPPHYEPGRRPRSESWLRAARDALRATLWCATGWDGGAVASLVHPNRARMAEERKDGYGEHSMHITVPVHEGPEDVPLDRASGGLQ